MYKRREIEFLFFFFFVDWLNSSFLLPLLSHPLYPHIHLSFTHLSLLPQPNSFSHFISILFSILFFASFKVPFLPLYLPVACLHLSRIFYSLRSLLLHFSSPMCSPCLLLLFFFLDASFSGWVCSEFLKPHLPLTLWPTCPSCSMWRSRTLEPQFWAPLMSSVCWDTIAMYPSWSKVCKKLKVLFYTEKFLDFFFFFPSMFSTYFFSLLFLSTRSGFQSPPGCFGCQQPLLSWPLQQLHQEPVWVALLSHTCLFWADPHVLLYREANNGC